MRGFMDEGMLLLFVGSSGSGKNTIINYLTKKHSNVEFLVSHTTREMRPGEKDGGTYNFVSVKEFEEQIENNEMLEHDITHKGYYGISKQTITKALSNNKVVVKDITINGLIKCKEELEDKANIQSIFLTERKSVLRKRLIGRGEENYKLRLKIYGKEQSQMGVCDYIIKNTTLEKSVEIVETVIEHNLNKTQILPYKNFKQVNVKKLNRYLDKLIAEKPQKPLKVGIGSEGVYLLSSPEKYLASLAYGKAWPKRFVNKKLKDPKKAITELDNWYNVVSTISSKIEE